MMLSYLEVQKQYPDMLILEHQLFSYIAYGASAIVLGQVTGFPIYRYDERKYVSAGTNRTEITACLSEKKINYILLERGRITERVKYAGNGYLDYLSRMDSKIIEEPKQTGNQVKILGESVCLYNKKREEVEVYESAQPGYLYAVYKGKTYLARMDVIGRELFFEPPEKLGIAPKSAINNIHQIPKQALPVQARKTVYGDKKSKRSKVQGYGPIYSETFLPSRPRERKRNNNQIMHYNYKGLNQFGYDQDGYDPNCGHPKYWKDDNFDEQL